MLKTYKRLCSISKERILLTVSKFTGKKPLGLSSQSSLRSLKTNETGLVAALETFITEVESKLAALQTSDDGIKENAKALKTEVDDIKENAKVNSDYHIISS